jgi:hypothetical protein
MYTYVKSLRVTTQNLCKPQLLELLLQATWQARIHATATTENDGLVQTAPDVYIRRLNGVKQEFGNTRLLNIDEVRLEKTLRRLEALAANTNDTAIGQCVRLDQDGCVFTETLIQLKIVRDIAELLLDLSDSLKVGGSVERISSSQQQGDQVAGYVTSSNVQSASEVVQNSRLVYGDNMCDTITRVNDDTG